MARSVGPRSLLRRLECVRWRDGAVSRLDSRAHPQAAVLKALLTAEPPIRGASEEQRLRGQLTALGAPLGGPALKSRRLPSEEVLAEGLVLAHHSPTVARVPPVALWRQRDKLDYARLERAATSRDERHTLGFYLELTGRKHENKVVMIEGHSDAADLHELWKRCRARGATRIDAVEAVDTGRPKRIAGLN